MSVAAIALVGCLVAQPRAEDGFEAHLNRLREESPGEYEKVLKLPRDVAAEFLRQRYGRAAKEERPGGTATKPDAAPRVEPGSTRSLPTRREEFAVLETLGVGRFSVDLCRRADGAFGLGEIRHGQIPIRRADFLVTWQVGGRFPAFAGRHGAAVSLRDPKARLTFFPERRTCAGTVLEGFRLHFEAEGADGSIVETASWEPGGSTKGHSYFDGYRGWHAPPAWLAADAVPETSQKLMPSLLHGTGFQLEYGATGALLIFHTSPGDRLKNASRGEALEFVTTFEGVSTIDRYVFALAGDGRINLWSRAFEVTQLELRRALDLPERTREVVCAWPPFGRLGFREMAEAHAEVTAREGFTAVYIDVIWDNLELHGGKKNMNVWDYSVCDGYGGREGLRALVDECKKRDLRVIAWAPAGHLNAGAPVWREHPDWVLKNQKGERALNPSGLVQGDLSSGFSEYFRRRFLDVIQEFRLDGLWMDSHLAYAQQYQSLSHGKKLAAMYGDFARAGAKLMIAEGDASALGACGVSIGEDWVKQWGKIPDPDLYYGATLMAWFIDGRLHQEHFRRYVASGAPWVVSRELLDSPKLTGAHIDAARRDALQVIRDYRSVRERMVHRFVHEDGSGYTWTNDRDDVKVVWLLAEAPLPDGRRGQGGNVYLIEPTD